MKLQNLYLSQAGRLLMRESWSYMLRINPNPNPILMQKHAQQQQCRFRKRGSLTPLRKMGPLVWIWYGDVWTRRRTENWTDGETKGREFIRRDDVSSTQRWFWQTCFFEPCINSFEGRDKTCSLTIHSSHAQVSHGAEPFVLWERFHQSWSPACCLSLRLLWLSIPCWHSQLLWFAPCCCCWPKIGYEHDMWWWWCYFMECTIHSHLQFSHGAEPFAFWDSIKVDQPHAVYLWGYDCSQFLLGIRNCSGLHQVVDVVVFGQRQDMNMICAATIQCFWNAFWVSYSGLSPLLTPVLIPILAFLSS